MQRDGEYIRQTFDFLDTLYYRILLDMANLIKSQILLILTDSTIITPSGWKQELVQDLFTPLFVHTYKRHMIFNNIQVLITRSLNMVLIVLRCFRRIYTFSLFSICSALIYVPTLSTYIFNL